MKKDGISVTLMKSKDLDIIGVYRSQEADMRDLVEVLKTLIDETRTTIFGGDFNLPLEVDVDADVRPPNYCPNHNYAVIEALSSQDLRDSFREVHGDCKSFTYFATTATGRKIGRRLDYILCLMTSLDSVMTANTR